MIQRSVAATIVAINFYLNQFFDLFLLSIIIIEIIFFYFHSFNILCDQDLFLVLRRRLLPLFGPDRKYLFTFIHYRTTTTTTAQSTTTLLTEVRIVIVTHTQ